MNEFIFQYDNVFKLPVGFFSDFIFLADFKESLSDQRNELKEFDNIEISSNITLEEIKNILLNFYKSRKTHFLNNQNSFILSLKLSGYYPEDPMKMFQFAPLRLLLGIISFDPKKIISSISFIVDNINKLSLNHNYKQYFEVEEIGTFTNLYFFENKLYFLSLKNGVYCENIKVAELNVEVDSIINVDNSLMLVFTPSINNIQ